MKNKASGKKSRRVTVIGILLLVGCASSGVVPAGPDTYILSGMGAGFWVSGGNVVADLYKEGNAYCASLGRQFLPISSSSIEPAPGRFPNGQIQFRCLLAGDPELQVRPMMVPTPNIRIESR